MLYRTPPGFTLGSVDIGLRYHANGGTEQIRTAPFVAPATTAPVTTAYVPPPSVTPVEAPASNGAPSPYRAAPNIPKWYAPPAVVPASVAPSTFVPVRPVSQPTPPVQLRPTGVTSGTASITGSGSSYGANGGAQDSPEAPKIPWLLLAALAGSMIF